MLWYFFILNKFIFLLLFFENILFNSPFLIFIHFPAFFSFMSPQFLIFLHSIDDRNWISRSFIGCIGRLFIFKGFWSSLP